MWPRAGGAFFLIVVIAVPGALAHLAGQTTEAYQFGELRQRSSVEGTEVGEIAELSQAGEVGEIAQLGDAGEVAEAPEQRADVEATAGPGKGSCDLLL
jgi:hypothetical protein